MARLTAFSCTRLPENRRRSEPRSVIRLGRGSGRKDRRTSKKLPNGGGLVRSNTGMANSDQALIRAVLAGDKEAYGVLVERHGESMFRVAFRITESEPDAEEIAQETFLRGCGSREEMSPGQSLPRPLHSR